jgi:uncharacterized protein (TIGR04255 family)
MAHGVEYPRSEAMQAPADPGHFRSPAADPHYQPKIRMFGEGEDVFIGDAILRVRIGGPYPGWEGMLARVDALLDVLEQSKVARAVERISLKFVNLLRDVPARQLEALRVDLRVNGETAAETGMHLRMEMRDEHYVRVVEIQPGAAGDMLAADRSAHGLVLALECRRDLVGEEFWKNRRDTLENLHFELRALFFQLLTREAMEKLGPIYRKPPSAG